MSDEEHGKVVEFRSKAEIEALRIKIRQTLIDFADETNGLQTRIKYGDRSFEMLASILERFQEARREWIYTLSQLEINSVPTLQKEYGAAIRAALEVLQDESLNDLGTDPGHIAEILDIYVTGVKSALARREQ